MEYSENNSEKCKTNQIWSVLYMKCNHAFTLQTLEHES
jgi:hypothetical protein